MTSLKEAQRRLQELLGRLRESDLEVDDRTELSHGGAADTLRLRRPR